MDISLRRVGSQNLYYTESETESAVQLIFTPGSFNPEIWKQQYRYFSKKYNTIVFEPTRNNKHVEGEKQALKNILDQDSIENAVLISNIVSNSLIQSFEDREDVVATFMTGNPSTKDLPPRSLYKLFWALNLRKPKLLRKSFFSTHTDYKVLKEFTQDVKPPSFRDLKSFIDSYGLRQSLKSSKTVYAEEDKFSSLEKVRSIQEDRSISVIERAGTFSFYEKPQEYNKALNDFLTGIEEQVRDNKVFEARQNNRSLFEFEKKRKEKTIRINR